MQRYEQLDSLRGIAALTVLIGHFMIVLPNMLEYTYGQDEFWLMNLFKYTPLYIIRSGHEAVYLFFLLSGFVLSLQFYKKKKVNYRDFVIRRFFRIYIPYIVSIFTAVILIKIINPNGISSLSNWFNSIWNEPITLGMIIEYIVMIFGVNNSATNTVVWSLIYEMDISLVFPIIMFFLLRFNWVVSLLGSLAIVLFLNILFPGNTISNLATFTFMFVCGALIAKHLDTLKNAYKKLNKTSKWAYLFLTLFFYMYGIFLVDVSWLHVSITDELMITLGSALLIILSLSSDTFSNILRKKPALFLGRISYSLYLYHTIVLFSIIYIFYEVIPLWLIWIISFILTLIVSHMSQKYIEAPANNFGKLIVKRLNNKTTELLRKSV